MRASFRNFGASSALAPAVFALLLAVMPRIAAQTEKSDAPPNPPSANALAGVVVNSVTGEPIRRALVQILNLPMASSAVLTDSEGRFQFAGLPDSDIVVAARKPGFFSEQELHPENPRPPELFHVGPNTGSIVLKLLPEATLSGRVATIKGDPLEDVPVRILEQRIVDGRKRWEQRGQSSTEEDGQFRLANLVPGVYLLVAGPSFGYVGARAPGAKMPREEAVGTMFYPGVSELEAGTPITISGGQQAQADFLLKPEPLFKVSGTVVGFTPGMGSGPQFTTKSGEPVPSPITFDGQTGKFEAKVPAGSYLLLVRSPDSSGAILGADLPLVVSSDVEGVTLALGPPINLPIVVEAHHTSTPTSEQPLATVQEVSRRGWVDQGVSMSTNRVRQPFFAQVRLISTETRLELQEFQADEQNAVLAVRNLAPGKYSVDLMPNSPWYVQSAVSGTTDVLRDDLVLVPGRRPEPLEVVLRDDGAQLLGAVLADGQPSSGAVVLIPDQASLRQARVSQAGIIGPFHFENLPPGDYKLLAFDSIERLEFRDPEALAPYLSKAVRVTLSPNEQTTISLERIQAGK